MDTIEEALRSTEIETILRAMNETFKGKKYANSKWYDSFVRFWAPYHRNVRDILDTNNSLRRQLQLSGFRNRPVNSALSSKSNLTDAEKQALQGVVGKTGAKIREVGADVERVYGQQVSKTHPLEEENIRIKKIAKQAKPGDEAEDFANQVRETEGDMDVLENTIDGASKRAGQQRWALADRENTYYQIRFPQQVRETGENTDRYMGITARHPKDSDYEVTKEWEVTVQNMKMEPVQVRDPKTGETRVRTTLVDTATRLFNSVTGK